LCRSSTSVKVDAQDAEAVFVQTSYWRVFPWNFQKADSYFFVPVVSHVDTPGFFVGEDGPSVCTSFVFVGGDSPRLCKGGMVFGFHNEEACSTVASERGSIVFVLSSLPISFLCEVLTMEDSVRNNVLCLFILCSCVFLGVTVWLHVPKRPRMLSW